MASDAANGDAGDIERRLLVLCAQALAVDAVGVEDNFFQLGGDSLSAMWLLSSIQDEFKVEIPLPLLFDAQTMSDVIAVIGRQLANASTTTDAAPEDSTRSHS